MEALEVFTLGRYIGTMKGVEVFDVVEDAAVSV